MRKVINLISSTSCPNSCSLDDQYFYTSKVFRMPLRAKKITRKPPNFSLPSPELAVLRAVHEDLRRWQEMSTREAKISGLTYKRAMGLILLALSKFRPPAS